MKKVILVLLIASLVSSCDIPNKMQTTMESWIGHYKSEIIQSWGPPTGGTTSDGKGGEILIYGNSRNLIAPVGNMYMSRSINDYQQVYCDPQGKIYYVRWGRE